MGGCQRDPMRSRSDEEVDSREVLFLHQVTAQKEVLPFVQIGMLQTYRVRVYLSDLSRTRSPRSVDSTPNGKTALLRTVRSRVPSGWFAALLNHKFRWAHLENDLSGSTYRGLVSKLGSRKEGVSRSACHIFRFTHTSRGICCSAPGPS